MKREKEILKQLRKEGGFTAELPSEFLKEILPQDSYDRKIALKRKLSNLSLKEMLDWFEDSPKFAGLQVKKGKLKIVLKNAIIEEIIDEIEFYFDLFDL